MPVGASVAAPLGKVAPGSVEFLDPVVIGIDHEDAVAAVDHQSYRAGELPVAGSQAPPLGEERSGAVEFLDLVVQGIGHVKVAVAIERRSQRVVKAMLHPPLEPEIPGRRLGLGQGEPGDQQRQEKEHAFRETRSAFHLAPSGWLVTVNSCTVPSASRYFPVKWSTLPATSCLPWFGDASRCR